MYKLIKNSKKYWDFIRRLRNHKSNQSGFVEQVNITHLEQEKYMAKHNNDYYICLGDNQPVGFIGVIENDIRVCTDPMHQKRGVGKFMVDEIMKIHPNACAKIIINNTASVALFEKCGFKKKFFILER